jgi:hypothetical protein
MRKVLGFALCSVLALPLPAVESTTPGPEYTLGDFAVAVATTIRLAVPQGGFSAESATAALREAGISLEGDSKSALTEADLVKALGQLGLKLTTENPRRHVPEARAVQILKVLEGTVARDVESSEKR